MTKSHAQPLTKVTSPVSEPVQDSTQTPEQFASDSMTWQHTYVCLLNISSAHGLEAIANRVYWCVEEDAINVFTALCLCMDTFRHPQG